MKANMLSLHTPATRGMGSKGHFVFFSKSGHVAYQIKEEEVLTYMQGNTLNLHTPLTSGVGFKRFDIEIVQMQVYFLLN